MKNWKLAPKDANIAKYVECYWFLERERSDVMPNHPKLNPDPSAHLIIGDSHQAYHYEHDKLIQKGEGSHWIFQHRKTFVMDHSKPFRILGIKFKIGALHTLNNFNRQIKLDGVVSVDIRNLFGSDSIQADHILTLAQNNHIKALDLIDKILLPCMPRYEDQFEEDRHAVLTRNILPLLSTLAIPAIGVSLKRSQRTIERSFLKTTHLTLKQCKSMILLEEILNYISKLDNKEINWPDLAYTFKFSDQPHLIRYLKGTIGETPSNYALKRNLTIDIYGDFEFN